MELNHALIQPPFGKDDNKLPPLSSDNHNRLQQDQQTYNFGAGAPHIETRPGSSRFTPVMVR